MLETEIKKLTAAVVMLNEMLITQGGASPLPAPTTSAAAPTTANSKKSEPALAAVPTDTPVADTPPADVTVEVPAAVPAAVATDTAPAAGAPAAEVPTKKQVVDKFIELAQKKDRTVAVALLAEYGIVKLPELKDKTLWAGFVAKIDALLST